MRELQYQQKYIAELAKFSKEYLEENYSNGYNIIFQAPTGSGKTYMISEAISKLVKSLQGKMELSFIWLSVNKLHEQSHQHLDNYFEIERLLNCIGIEEIQDNQLEENDILFLNWDKLIKKDNLFMRDNERDFNLSSIIKNTKEEARVVILIIDESHRTAQADKAKEVRKIISPKLTIEMTATPKDTASDHKVRVRLPEVIREEMIKKEVQINPDILEAKTNQDILRLALKKRESLKKQYNELKKDINPLLLIQVPNKKPQDTIAPEDYMIGLLNDEGLTTQNGKLAIKLSEKDKQVNLEFLEEDNNQTEVLIFKESIAVGWDCPRAAILFLQREWNAERYEFNIQTLGRIMRMPEQKHYEDYPDLNIGYVYSVSDNFSVIDDLAKNYATNIFMKRDNQKYKNLSLVNEYIRRKRELTRLSSEFRRCLLDTSNELKEDIDKIVTEDYEAKKSIGVRGTVKDIDLPDSTKFKEEIKIEQSAIEIDQKYWDFCREITSPFQKSHSDGIIKSSIRAMFGQHFQIYNEDKIGKIVINPTNNATIRRIVEKAKENYSNIPQREDKVVPTKRWQVPENVGIFTEFEKKSDIKKSIFLPFYIKKNINGKLEWSKPEEEFIKRLERTDDDVLWWYKNGVQESRFLGIAYQRLQNGYYAFYPDFIIKTKSETIIVEIKDDRDFKLDNFLKLNAGKTYLKKYQKNFSEKVYFFINSPNDYTTFFDCLKNQNISSFKSSYEKNLFTYNISLQVMEKQSKDQKQQDDPEKMQLYQELDKALNEISNVEEKNMLLNLELKEAQKNIKILSSHEPHQKQAIPKKLDIPKPFNFCILGGVTSKSNFRSELRIFFEKYNLKASDWNIDFFDNVKLSSSDILKSLIQGRSKYNLIITGQIYHHSTRGNKKANLISELKNKKYVPHITGCNPREELTILALKEKIQDYFKKFEK